ncbi:CAP domain-containing protein [Paenibacillus sp. GYB003]|uniref:CAP domain-containing protein n=1 Tax=Paenibacillus sp. GYB003 TaxID=2994392 RepID=UPI002F96D342
MKSCKKLLLLMTAALVLLFGAAVQANAFGKGAKGPDVFAVQGMLKSLGYFNGTITGYYGSETEAAVKRFQQKYGLTATGSVDDKTLESILWAYASAKLPKRAPPVPAPQRPRPKQTPAPAPAPTPAPKPNPAPEPPEQISPEELQMVELVNKARQEASLSPLTVDAPLSEVARLKSEDMAEHNYFSHQSPTYGSPFEMMSQFNISYSSAGENIACNQTVQGAHETLMNSPGHRENILNPTFTHIGVGIVDGGKCGKIVTQQFIAR